MVNKDLLNGSLNIVNGLKVLKDNFVFYRENPDYFTPAGLITFCGKQGSGKTLSLVNYVQQIINEFPRCVIVSNIELFNIPGSTKVIYYSNINQLFRLFEEVKNGYYGVVYIVDEIQILFNALLKRAQNVQTIEVISQQRKQRKHIIGTAQNFGKIDKVFREQMENVVICRKLFNCLQLNKLCNGDDYNDERKEFSKVYKHYLWFHTRDLYASYDTSAIISAYREEFVNSELSEEAYNNFKKWLGGFNNERGNNK